MVGASPARLSLAFSFLAIAIVIFREIILAMNQEDKQKQINIAKAMLRRFQRSLQDGSATAEQVEAAKKRIDELENFSVTGFQKVLEKEHRAALRVEQAGSSRFEPMSDYPPEVQALIEKLIGERDEVHAKKAIICNALHKVPNTTICADEVRAILKYRNEWKALNAKVRFVQQFGQLPPEEETVDLSKNTTLDETGFEKAQNVKELWALRQDIENRRSVLSKSRKSLNGVADLAKVAHYKQKVALLEWELRIMSAVFEARK